MKVKVGMKKSSKKKLERSTWAGHVEKRDIKNGKESRCPESGMEMEARKTEIAMGDCIKSYLETVRKEWENIWIEGLEEGCQRT